MEMLPRLITVWLSAQASPGMVPLYELGPSGEMLPSDMLFVFALLRSIACFEDVADRRDWFRSAGDVSLELAFEFSDPLFVLNV